MDNVAIMVGGVSKDFKFSSARANTLKSIFTGALHQKNKDEKIQPALKDISFDVKKGEFFGIVGRNGSGKSTLLKILAGIYQPKKGTVQVRGKLVPFIELGVGFNPELTGKENVYMNGALLGFSDKEVKGFYKEVVEFAELENFMDKKLKNYSSGMQVRLAFSMAIRADADILLIDEVLAVGDTDFQRKCFRYFKQLKKENKTVVFVTHDMNAVREFCDRAAFIEKSRLISIGEPDVIAEKYEKLLAPTSTEHESSSVDTGLSWGDKTMAVENPKIFRDSSKKIGIKMQVRAKESCDDPIFGFVFKSSTNTALAGTNTMLEKIKVQPMEAGEVRDVTWLFDNVYPNGEYFISLAVLYDSGVTIADWVEDALSVKLRNMGESIYPTIPNIEHIIE